MLSLAQRVTRWSRVDRRLLSSSAGDGCPVRPYKILFCGTDSFAAKSLNSLIQRRDDLCPELYVLTPPDVVQSWGASRMRVSPVKSLALQYDLPCQQVPSGGMAHYSLPAGFVTPLHETCPASTILLTCSFGHMIPDQLLRAFPHPYQRLNIHPSLLPQLRGAAPIQWSISRRLATSGVSIQSLESRKFDSGRIFAQQQISFPPPNVRDQGAAYVEIEAAMAHEAAHLLIQMLDDLPGHVDRSWEQDSNAVTRAPKVKLTDCRICFDVMSADQVLANHRAFSYLVSPACVSHATKRKAVFTDIRVLKPQHHLYCTLVPQQPGFPHLETSFHKLSIVTSSQLQTECASTWEKIKESKAGWATYSPGLDAIVVQCADTQHLLLVHTLQSKGKKLRPAKDWWTAYRDRANAHTMLCFQ